MIEKFETPNKVYQPSLGKTFKAIPCAPYISLYADADTANEEINPNNSFYYVTLPYKGKVLSQEALRYGQQHGDALIFDEKHGQIIVEYELLRSERRCNAAIKNSVTAAVDRELKEISMHGSYDYPDYFGTLPPPALTPYGIPTRCINAAHGVYFLEAEGQLLLSVDYLYWSFYEFIGGTTLSAP